MYPITNEVKALFEAEQRKVLRITGTDKNGAVISITDNDVIADSFQIDRYSCNGEKLEVGTAIAAQMTLTLENGGGQYNGIVFEGAELFVEVGIADWTQSSHTITYVPCGYFTPDNQPRRLSTISITGLDRMTKFDVVVDAVALTFPTTIAGLVGQVCTLCGVTLAQSISGLVNAGVNVAELPTAQEEITYRNLIQWCAGVMGTNAWFDWNGQLRFSWYENATGYVSTADNRYSSDLYEDDLTVSGVEYTNDSGIVIVEGTDDYAIDLTGNAIVGPLVATVLPPLNTALNGFTYRPFTAATVNAPYLWPMDIVTFTDKDGNNHTSALTNVAFGLNGTTAMESKGMTYAINKLAQPKGFTREQAQLVNQAMEHVEQDIDESLTQQEIFNRLTDNGAAQGLVLYNGQLYINASYINTGYLSAARIKGDTLTLGGANNVNGEIQVLDASGNEVGSITKDGIVTAAVYSSDTISVKLNAGAITMLNSNIEMGRIWAAKIADSNDVALFINGPANSGTDYRSGLSLWPGGDVNMSSGDGAAEFILYKSGTASINADGDVTINSGSGAASLVLGSDGTISVSPQANWRAALDITPANIGAVAKSGDTINGNLIINGNLTVNADGNIDLTSDYGVTIGDTDAKIVKLTDGTVYMQSSGDASVYVTDDGDTEMRSDGGAASIILKSDGDINVTGSVSLIGSIDSSLTVNDSLTLNGDLTVNADNNINLTSDYEVAIGDTDAKIVKHSDGTVHMQSSGDASVYVTNGGNAEIRSDGGAASIILTPNGDVNVSGDVALDAPLTVPQIYSANAAYPAYSFANAQNTQVAVIYYDIGNKNFIFRYDPNGQEEHYVLPTSTGSGGHYILTDKSPVTIPQGGTGATTPDGACANIGAVKKSGDTMTGPLTVPNMVVRSGSWQFYFMQDSNGAEVGHVRGDEAAHHIAFREITPGTNGTAYEDYYLPNPTIQSGAASYFILTSKSAVTIPQGGTGATDAPGARANLGIATTLTTFQTEGITENGNFDTGLKPSLHVIDAIYCTAGYIAITPYSNHGDKWFAHCIHPTTGAPITSNFNVTIRYHNIY